jgi:pimeloyl-ACP methyl ester carboxylesterase
VGVAPLDPELFDWSEGLARESVSEFELARTAPDALLARISPQAERMLGEGSAMIEEWSSVLPPSDLEIEQRPENVVEAQKGTRLALKQGPAGWFDDDISFTRRWGFELESIRVPVDLWCGAEDVLVSASYGRYLAAQIPTSELTIVPGRGHRLDDEMPAILRRLRR